MYFSECFDLVLVSGAGRVAQEGCESPPAMTAQEGLKP